jgi:putative YjhG/YagF family dehydratase
MPHSALAPSGQSVWYDVALQSARTLVEMAKQGITMRKVLSQESIENAMAVHAAFGGSTNLLLHLPAVAHAAGLKRPKVDDWIRINRLAPRIVDVLPNGPKGHPTVRAFLAGGVPEVMLHLRELGIIHTEAMTITGKTWNQILDEWEKSERRHRFRQILLKQDGVDPNEVIFNPNDAKLKGLASTLTFPTGNLAPEGAVVKSTAIDPSVINANGVFQVEGPVKVFTREKDAIRAIKKGTMKAGDIIVLIGGGPMGNGMEETYQVTSALKHIPFGKQVALVTDARFSGVSTGACIGHVGPEALAGGPIGRLRDGDIVRIIIDTRQLIGSIDFISDGIKTFDQATGLCELLGRPMHPCLGAHELLTDDTRLWAFLQQFGGGAWGGCVYDYQSITKAFHNRLT